MSGRRQPASDGPFLPKVLTLSPYPWPGRYCPGDPAPGCRPHLPAGPCRSITDRSLLLPYAFLVPVLLLWSLPGTRRGRSCPRRREAMTAVPMGQVCHALCTREMDRGRWRSRGMEGRTWGEPRGRNDRSSLQTSKLSAPGQRCPGPIVPRMTLQTGHPGAVM